MNSHIDFLNFKTIARYLLIFGLVLAFGAILKDFMAVLISAVIIFFAISGRYFRSVEWWMIWFFLIGFYDGLGFITIEVVSKYIAKPSFLLFIIFILNIRTIKISEINNNHILFFLFFLIFTFLSLLFHNQSIFASITVCSFYFIYILCGSLSINKYRFNLLLNLFIAIAFLQTILCILQLTEVIPPAVKMMEDGSGNIVEWEAGLDDAATGTFGAGASHLVSWYAALVGLFCFLLWSKLRRNGYILATLISIIQFATVDSKTIMGVMIAMFGYTIIYILNRYNSFKLNYISIFRIFIIVIVSGYLMINAYDSYYKYYASITGSSTRSDLDAVLENEVKESTSVVSENWVKWGKINGFGYVMDDFIEEGPKEILFGYGLQGYTFNGKMSFIESKDDPIMQLNNLTNSRSGLITHFATSGIFGVIFLLISLIYWYKYELNRPVLNDIDLIKQSLVKVFSIFSIIASFLYSVTFTSITIIAFAALIGILKNSKHIIYYEYNKANSLLKK